jgi:DNA polymerase-3 subunit delta
VKLYPDQLDTHLKGRLAPVYILSGDEPLQLMEAADAIRQAAKAAGHTSREIFYADGNFDWSQLQEACDSFSLFGEPRILDLRLPGKPDKAGAAALLRYAERPPHDAILLISLPKLTAADQKIQWFQALESTGAFIQVWPLDGEKLLRWLDRRLNGKGLLADQSGLRLIAARVEGNLLAAAQEIEKLHILYGHGRLTDEQIMKSVADHARYDVFDLADQVLRGQTGKACRVLMGLKAEGVAAPVVLWALTREIRLVNTLKNEVAGGASPESVFSKYKLWDNRKTALSQALQRLNRGHLQQALLLSGQADRIIKGMKAGDEWDALLAVCASVTEPNAVIRGTR